MEDIPQPSNKPYIVGKKVRVYIAPEDADRQYHDTVCEVMAVLTDDLGIETGRSTEAYSYTLRDIDSKEKLPIEFRHHDLVPVEDD